MGLYNCGHLGPVSYTVSCFWSLFIFYHVIQFFVWLQNFPKSLTHAHTHTHTQTCYSSFNVENTQRSNVTMRTILCRQFHGIKYCLPVGTQPAHQPTAASKHRGCQPNCAAHCQNSPQHPPRPRLNNRCTSQWPKESPSVPAEGEVDKGERDERRDKRESPQHLVFPAGLATKY